KEMYPDVEYCDYDFGSSDKVMEGKYRPGHFTGVAQIVEKLLKLTEPDKAYFGLKDYQQFVIINELVRQRNFPVQIIGCPTIREADGLAMSSRNRLLSPDQRNSAAKISQALFMMREKAEYISLQEMKKWVVGTINSDKNMEVEYFEIVDSTDLSPLNEWNDSLNRRGCIAVWVGTTRLIDNISIEGVKYNN
ncbi:MAG: pantoate--beta-alanine ligase, partial [Bacteroidetes bacterium]|nr:pantoate--beta-alanine ligase [Bacteroidota bacterium]